MHNPRRFAPNQKKNTTPSTPSGPQRVLLTPPTSATPTNRLAATNDNANSSPRNAAVASAQTYSTTTPKLNISRLSKQNKGQRNDLRPEDHSPARAPKSRGQAQAQATDVSAEKSAHFNSIFGQQNGLLLPVTRQSSPASPIHTDSVAQRPNSRFSSPVSPVAEGTMENVGSKAPSGVRANLDYLGPHTSAPNVFGRPQIDVDVRLSRQQGLRSSSSVSREKSFASPVQEDFDDQVVGSPSPTRLPKRRAENHGAHVPTKRARSNLHQEYDENDFPSQEQDPAENIAAMTQDPYSASLAAYIVTHEDEWIAAQKRWEDCTMDEWKNGTTELTAELSKVMDMVKDFMMKRMEVYVSINKDVEVHKARLDARDGMLAKEKERLVKHAGSLAGSFAS